MIELEVDTRKGLNETVWIRNDTAQILIYEFHPEGESWEESERICDAEGGHLASINPIGCGGGRNPPPLSYFCDSPKKINGKSCQFFFTFPRYVNGV